MLGLPKTDGNLAEILTSLLSHLSNINGPTVILGFGCLGFLFWVVVSGFDDRFVYVTDPDIGEDDEPYNGSDCVSVPILRHEFDLMARYGRSKLQAAVFIAKA